MRRAMSRGASFVVDGGLLGTAACALQQLVEAA